MAFRSFRNKQASAKDVHEELSDDEFTFDDVAETTPKKPQKFIVTNDTFSDDESESSDESDASENEQDTNDIAERSQSIQFVTGENEEAEMPASVIIALIEPLYTNNDTHEAPWLKHPTFYEALQEKELRKEIHRKFQYDVGPLVWDKVLEKIHDQHFASWLVVSALVDGNIKHKTRITWNAEECEWEIMSTCRMRKNSANKSEGALEGFNMNVEMPEFTHFDEALGYFYVKSTVDDDGSIAISIPQLLKIRFPTSVEEFTNWYCEAATDCFSKLGISTRELSKGAQSNDVCAPNEPRSESGFSAEPTNNDSLPSKTGPGANPSAEPSQAETEKRVSFWRRNTRRMSIDNIFGSRGKKSFAKKK